VSFGTELVFILLLALLVLGPKRLQTTLAQIARAKTQFENATHSFKSQLAADFDEAPRKGKTGSPPVLVGDLTISSESRDK
jgi:Sec-independent protein translocase protein TatA